MNKYITKYLLNIFYKLKDNNAYILIIILIIIGTILALSTNFIITSHTNNKYLITFINKQKAYWLAKSGIEIAIKILEADKKGLMSGFAERQIETNTSIDTYKDLWAIPIPDIELEGGSIKISIEDENSKINLSVLANEFVDNTPYYAITQRFFLNMGLPIDLADCILDWVDIDDIKSPYGAEFNDYYQNLPISYKPKNGEMDSISELLLIKGISPIIYYGLGGGNYGLEENLVEDNKGIQDIINSLLQGKSIEKTTKNISEIKIGKEKNRALYNYFRVYGDRSDYLNDLNKININTASYRVLSSLTDDMTDDKVTEIIRRRLEQPFKDVNEISDIITDENIRKNLLTVKSYIFMINSTGKVGKVLYTIQVYYNRERNKIIYWAEY